MSFTHKFVLRTLTLGVFFIGVFANPLRDGNAIREATASGLCLCMPGDACWPSETEWSNLNATVGGRLIATTPLASVCHDPAFNAQACTTLQKSWILPQTHIVSPSSIEAPLFQNASCDPFTPEAKPCTLGNYINYAIDVINAADISAGLAFAKKTNIRLVIKNTGHDLLGKSTGRGALGLWTHNLKSIDFLNYEGSNYKGSAIKVGAGVQAYEAYAAANARGLRVIGGTCPTVGLAGGYTQGGGHSTLSSTYGLAADNALEWEVITAAGTHVVASQTQNQDLYWALSGGGAGAFAVVLSLTSRAFTDGIMGGASLTFNSDNVTLDTYWDAIGLLHEAIPAYVDVGGIVDYTATRTALIENVFNFPGKTKAQVSTLVQPLKTSLTKLGINFSMNVTSFPTFIQHFNNYFGPLPYGVETSAQVTGSRLIPRSVVLNDNRALTATLQNITSSGDFFVVGLGISAPLTLSSNNTSTSNAVLPAWRTALLHLVVGADWNFTAPISDNLALQARLTNEIVPSLETLTPGSGAYLNEANFEQSNFQQDFYGANYPKLLQVKREWDPDNLFYATTAVGSEAFEVAADGRLCRS